MPTLDRAVLLPIAAAGLLALLYAIYLIFWVLRQPELIAIPKASTIDHVRENRGALEIRLTADDLNELDRAFPPPSRKIPLQMI